MYQKRVSYFSYNELIIVFQKNESNTRDKGRTCARCDGSVKCLLI